MATVYILSRVSPASRPMSSSSFALTRTITTVPSTPAFKSSTPTLDAVLGALSTVQTDPGGSAGAALGATGLGKQFEAAQQTLTSEAYKSCGLCPDSVVNMIADEVREVSAMVLRVKRLSTLLNQILEGAEQAVLELINGFIDLIPSPPLLDLTQVAKTLMCPLLPQAILSRSYQNGVASAHRLASSTTPFGSLNPAYYPVLATGTWKFGFEYGAQMASGAVDAVEGMFRQWAAQWRRMAKEFWRRFLEYLDTQNPYTDFGAGGRASPAGAVNEPTGRTGGGKFLRVSSLSDVVNPVEGQVVYIERTVDVPDFSGYRNAAAPSPPDASTVNNPLAGASRRTVPSAEDQGVQALGGMSFNRTRYVFRGGGWRALSDSSLKKFVKLFFRVLMEFYSAVRNVGYFTVRVATTKASVALVRSTCPAVYNSSGYPFKAYDELTRDFKMQGFVPSGIGSSSRPFVDAAMRLILKIEAWTAASYVTVV